MEQGREEGREGGREEGGREGWREGGKKGGRKGGKKGGKEGEGGERNREIVLLPPAGSGRARGMESHVTSYR